MEQVNINGDMYNISKLEQNIDIFKKINAIVAYSNDFNIDTYVQYKNFENKKFFIKYKEFEENGYLNNIYYDDEEGHDFMLIFFMKY